MRTTPRRRANWETEDSPPEAMKPIWVVDKLAPPPASTAPLEARTPSTLPNEETIRRGCDFDEYVQMAIFAEKMPAGRVLVGSGPRVCLRFAPQVHVPSACPECMSRLRVPSVRPECMRHMRRVRATNVHPSSSGCMAGVWAPSPYSGPKATLELERFDEDCPRPRHNLEPTDGKSLAPLSAACWSPHAVMLPGASRVPPQGPSGPCKERTSAAMAASMPAFFADGLSTACGSSSATCPRAACIRLEVLV